MDPAQALTRYLYVAHDAVRWKLDGLSEYDLRRPLTDTGTNLLGIVKHLAWVELGYFGDCFDRPVDAGPSPMASDEFNTDMYAAADETPARIWELFDQAQATAQSTIADLGLDAEGHVPWWGDANPVTVHWIAIHMVAEVHRHLGQIDILREGIDGSVGYRETATNLPGPDEVDWPAYVAKLHDIADSTQTDES